MGEPINSEAWEWYHRVVGEGRCPVVEGNLILKDSWPGQMRSIYRDHQRFIDTYFKIL